MQSKAHTSLSALVQALRQDPSSLPMSCPVLIEANETLEQDRIYATMDTGRADDISLGPSNDPRVHLLHKSADSEFPNLIGLGRASKNDLSIRTSSVSKIHAYIEETPAGRWEISDAESRNGTWVNRARLPKGASEALRDGVEVALGKARFLFFTPEGLRQYVLEHIQTQAPR
jgi:hypothetical protein